MGRDKDRDSPDTDLAEAGGKVRLFVETPLAAGAKLAPSEAQAHYLLHVMRARAGMRVLLFNGRDGEWRARIVEVTRRGCALLCETETQAQAEVPDLWLAFAPIKKIPADYLAQKATELGAKVLQPVITNRTVARRVNLERMRANAIEAAEQSGRLSVPEIREPAALDALLRSWPTGRRLLFCDEGGDAVPIAKALDDAGQQAQWGILTGPEGGFDPEERESVRRCSFVLPVALGPRIMRADTAALAALSVWQAICGDWPRLVSRSRRH
jgi:16S rRNA (uracil1498-N3)-methyltransferase